jgi:hypothetical protein
VPTGHGKSRLHNAEQTQCVSVTGPLSLDMVMWPTVGVGLHLLSLVFTGDGREQEFTSHDAILGIPTADPVQDETVAPRSVPDTSSSKSPCIGIP